MNPVSHDDPSWLRPRTIRASGTQSKTTVYLGGELLARVYELRSRGIDINVSRVCQLALEQAIHQAEELAPPEQV